MFYIGPVYQYTGFKQVWGPLNALFIKVWLEGSVQYIIWMQYHSNHTARPARNEALRAWGRVTHCRVAHCHILHLCSFVCTGPSTCQSFNLRMRHRVIMAQDK
jgi:hypothetical protein